MSVNKRVVKVQGPRGKIVKDFSHLKLQISLKSQKEVAIRIWGGGKKHNACARTIATHIKNMINGVVKGFVYKMRLVYAHFPIGVNIINDGKALEIRNFLGESVVRKVTLLDGVIVKNSTTQKDEIILTGVDVQKVSQSAATIKQSCAVKNKDIRKFLDGIYVSEKLLNEDNL